MVTARMLTSAMLLAISTNVTDFNDNVHMTPLHVLDLVSVLMVVLALDLNLKSLDYTLSCTAGKQTRK